MVLTRGPTWPHNHTISKQLPSDVGSCGGCKVTAQVLHLSACMHQISIERNAYAHAVKMYMAKTPLHDYKYTADQKHRPVLATLTDNHTSKRNNHIVICQVADKVQAISQASWQVVTNVTNMMFTDTVKEEGHQHDKSGRSRKVSSA